jgi:protein arginine N-methyltransferase 3
VIHGLCGWFDTFFDAPQADSIFFSTGPLTTPTHWKQTLFVLDHFISVQKGEKLMGQFICQKHEENPRELKVDLTLTTVNGEVYQQGFLVR